MFEFPPHFFYYDGQMHTDQLSSMTLSTTAPIQKLSSAAVGHLKSIEKIFFGAGLGESAPRFFTSLEAQLMRSPDDTMAATNLLRFIESSFSPISLLRDLSEHPVLLETALSIFSSSQFFSDILIRDPELFRWLTATSVLEQADATVGLEAAARQSIEPFQSIGRKVNTLKRFQRREMLRIGVRDLLRLADLETTTRELSQLADVIVSLSAELSWREIRNQYGAEPQTSWTIFGLGKLGGEELNYSSDIDILALFDEDGEMVSAASVKITYGEFFVRFIEHFVQLLTHPTEEGYFYRVDLRLRPDGNSGALIRSYASTMMYYESRGELWERQMLIKARHVAGDKMFARKFLTAISPFVYPRTFFDNPIEEISKIKTRIESNSHERNIKLRAGGIRDIEFIVQALQLLNGGKNPDIRNTNTLASLALLKAANILSDTEAGQLHEAYVFFRVLEHRLQMLQYAQTHSLPSARRERKRLAARMHLSADEFDRLLRKRTHDVRSVFNAVFTPQPARIYSSLDHFLDGKPGSDFSREFAGRYGLDNYEKAQRIIRRMTFGSNLLGKKEYPERTGLLFRAIAEPLLETIGSSIAPDYALAHCERIVSSFPSPDAMYSLCAENKFRSAFVKICAESSMLTNRFALSPGLAETILTSLNVIVHDDSIPPPPAGYAHDWKVREECKSALRYILVNPNEEGLFRSLSEIARHTLVVLCETESKKLKLPASTRFAIIGLGKLGGREINFGSDLDVLFLYEATKKSDAEKCEQLAARIMTSCSGNADSGKLYDIDARLRPEGRNAPLAVAAAPYLEYLHNRASLWERQSLTRARFIAGNEEFARSMSRMIDQSVYEAPLPKNWAGEILSMRAKTESRSRTTSSDFFDIKLGRGGMMDVEFTIQALQLSRRGNAFRSTNMYELLEYYARDLNHGARIVTMERNYRLLRRVETALRLGLDQMNHVIPSDDESLRYLSRLLNIPSSTEFLSMLQGQMKETRTLFDQILRTLS